MFRRPRRAAAVAGERKRQETERKEEARRTRRKHPVPVQKRRSAKPASLPTGIASLRIDRDDDAEEEEEEPDEEKEEERDDEEEEEQDDVPDDEKESESDEVEEVKEREEKKQELPALEDDTGTIMYSLNPLFTDECDRSILRVDQIAYPRCANVPPPSSKKKKKKDVPDIPPFTLTYKQEEGPQCGSRIVFLDLEVHNSAASKRISQIACVSLDGTRVFNRYVYWDALHPAWQELVAQELVMKDPWDDLKQSKVFYEVMEDLCNTFLPGSLFVFQGSVDFSWILKNFFLYHGLNEVVTQRVLNLLDQVQFRFVSITAFFSQPGFTASSPRYDQLATELKLKKRGLGELYDSFFHYSLLFLKDQQRFVYSNTMYKKVKEATRTQFADVSVDAFEAAAKATQSASFYIPYWTNKHLQPLLHYAHTDVQILRDIVIAWLLFLDIDARDELKEDDPRTVFADLMTVLVTTRSFFRATHLKAPEPVAQFLFTRLLPSARPLTRSVVEQHIQPGAYSQAKLSDDPLRSIRQVKPFDNTAPHNSLIASSEWQEDAETTKKYPSAKSSFMALRMENGNRIRVRRPDFKNRAGGAWASRVDVMRAMMIHSNPSLSITGKNSPFDFNPFVQEAERAIAKTEWEWDPVVGDRPWYVILSEAGKSFPKTLVLHSPRCVSLVDPLDPERKRARPAYKSDLYIINFHEATKSGEWPHLPFYLKFHKECKRHVSIPVESVPAKNRRKVAPIGQSLLKHPFMDLTAELDDDDDKEVRVIRSSLNRNVDRARTLNTRNFADFVPPRNSFATRVLASQSISFYRFPNSQLTYKE
jgi:hypothetical protein